MTYKFDFPTNSSFNFVHLVNNVQHKVHILYNSYDDTYYMDIDKFVDGKYINILNSIRLTLGVDLFLQYKYYNLGEFLIIPTTSKVYKSDPKAATIKENFFILWTHN